MVVIIPRDEAERDNEWAPGTPLLGEPDSLLGDLSRVGKRVKRTKDRWCRKREVSEIVRQF